MIENINPNNALSNLSQSENAVAKMIVKELAATGNSRLLENLYYQDYEEIPVSIDRFISDDRYMGRVYNNGDNIYPFWKETLHNFFHANPDKAFELMLTGAIGVGKSTIASIALTYLMYKTLCLKDPQKFYGLTSNSPIVFVVMNLTLDLAYSGLYSLIVESIKMSPWFCERVDIRGQYNFSIEFPKNVALIAGSQTQHTIGKNVLGACLSGDTIIHSVNGDFTIESLVNTENKFHTLDINTKEISIGENSLVIETKKVSKLYCIELEDGTVVKCTPDHRFLLTTGEYKEAQYLTEDDEIEEVAVNVWNSIPN